MGYTCEYENMGRRENEMTGKGGDGRLGMYPKKLREMEKTENRVIIYEILPVHWREI
ncbi:MAG: hypothetical protein K9H65_00945 [Bacteroidales bacterium]|nr:hypothetical protein [Bacteroidales bacterium]